MRKYGIIFLITLLVSCAIDRISKYCVLSFLDEQRVFLLGDNLFLHYSSTAVYQGLAAIPLWLVLITYGVIAIALIISMQKSTSSLFAIGSGLVLGGGISNIIDRVFTGRVIDWIGVGNIFVCNIADAMIIVGILICLLTMYDRTRTINRADRT